MSFIGLKRKQDSFSDSFGIVPKISFEILLPPPFFLIESMFVSSSHHFLLDREPVSTVEKQIEKMEELRDNNPLSISILSSIYENNNQSDITVYT